MAEEKLLISYCGICCSLCPGYKPNGCPGCPELKDCKIVQCAESKNIRYCFKCNEFPCKLFEKGFEWNDEMFGFSKNWKPYSKEYIKIFKIAKRRQKL